MEQKPWTVRMKASEEQRGRIKAAAAHDGKEIGEWVLEVADAAAVSASDWKQVHFSVLIPFSDPGVERDPTSDMNPTVDRLMALEERLGQMQGLGGLGGIVRFASRQHPDGLLVGYRTSTQLADALAVAKIVAHQVGELGVRVDTWGAA